MSALDCRGRSRRWWSLQPGSLWEQQRRSPYGSHLSTKQASVSTGGGRPHLPCPGGPRTSYRAHWDFLSLREAILRGMDRKVVLPVPPGHRRPQLWLLHLHPQPCASELPEMGSGCPSNYQQRTLRREEVRTVQGMGGAWVGPGRGRGASPHRARAPQGRARALEQ